MPPFNHVDNFRRARMGASEIRVRKTSLRRIAGEVRTDEIVCWLAAGEFGETGVVANV